MLGGGQGTGGVRLPCASSNPENTIGALGEERLKQGVIAFSVARLADEASAFKRALWLLF